MKAIISHDVDHITAWEHWRDGLILKHIARNLIEYVSRHISLDEVLRRFADLVRNKWQNLDSLMSFNRANNVPATFFFGVAKGQGLRYELINARYWMRRVSEENFDIGVHGIAFEKKEAIKAEREQFGLAMECSAFGIRMHYLRLTGERLHFLSQAGYSFDSSVPEMRSPYRLGALWEFPLHIMDGFILCKGTRWQNQNLHQCRESTMRVIDEVEAKGIPYLTILFHDRYFTQSFKTWQEWYIWVIDYLKQNKIEFVSYRRALKELEADGTHGDAHVA